MPSAAPYLISAYQHAALRTALGNDRVYFALGLAGEAGEVCNYIKKVVGHGHAMDPMKLGDEIGDVLWYTTAVAAVWGFDLAQVARVATFEAVQEWTRARGVLLHAGPTPLNRLALQLLLPVDDIVRESLTPSPFPDAIARGVFEILTALAALAAAVGLTLEECARANIVKLEKRYPAGWSQAASIARVDVEPPAAGR